MRIFASTSLKRLSPGVVLIPVVVALVLAFTGGPSGAPTPSLAEPLSNLDRLTPAECSLALPRAESIAAILRSQVPADAATSSALADLDDALVRARAWAQAGCPPDQGMGATRQPEKGVDIYRYLDFPRRTAQTQSP